MGAAWAIPACLWAVAMAGCASAPEPPQPIVQEPDYAACIEPRPVMQFAGESECRDNDPVWGPASGQRHTHREMKAHSNRELTEHRRLETADADQAASNDVDPMTRAWERYCDAGQGMTDEDWRLIEKEGMRIPDHLRSTCLPPK